MKWKHHEFNQIVNFQLRKVAMTTSFFPKYLRPCYFKSKIKNKKKNKKKKKTLGARYLNKV